jgi:hypothetical protein
MCCVAGANAVPFECTKQMLDTPSHINIQGFGATPLRTERRT